MARICGINTKPEKQIRHALFMSGFRYRKNVKTLPGTPDLVLAKYRTCIFVNGCFWHGHEGCKHYTVPETNHGFWIDKVAKNHERDMRVIAQLESLNWYVITVWECELKKSVINETLSRIEVNLAENKAKWDNYKIRRKIWEFSQNEAKRLRSIRSVVENELNEQFHIPINIRDLSKDVDD